MIVYGHSHSAISTKLHFLTHHTAYTTMFPRFSVLKNLLLIILFLTHIHSEGSSQTLSRPLTDDERFVKARVYFTPTFGVEEAENVGVEVEHGILKGDKYVESVISRTTLQTLRENKIRVDILIDDAAKEAEDRIKTHFRASDKIPTAALTGETPRNFKLGTFGGFFRLEEIYAEFARMRELYPTLVSAPETIGTSVEGLPIYAYKICTAEATTARKPEVFYNSLHHAREPGGASSLIYYFWWLLEKSADNSTAQYAEARYLLSERQLYVVPVVNPDGYLWNQTTNPAGGGMWRKNRRPNQDGSIGVDLNRNYGIATFWSAPNNGSSTNPRSDTYRGTEPFSEPETQAIRDFCNRRNFRTAINFHTFSNLLIYPFSYINRETPDSTYYRALTAEITKDNLYSAGRDLQTVGYAVRGSSDDWMYAGLSGGRKIMAYTPEVGTPDDGFWPPADRIVHHGTENIATNRLTAWSAGVNLRPVQRYVTESPISGSTRFVIEVQNIGIQDALETSALQVRSLARGVTFVRSERMIRPLRSTEISREVFDMIFDSTVRNGSIIPAEIIILQERVPRRDTVNVQILEAQRVSLFSERSDATNWQLGRWGVITDPITGKNALTDSPQGLYLPNEQNYVQSARAISLVNLRAATLEFQTRWSVESNGDLAVVQLSEDNGLTWKYLKTPLMKSGVYAPNIAAGGFGYDGNFPQWIRQECTLNEYLGKNIFLRFGMISDAASQFDGILVSDVALRLYSDTLQRRSTTTLFDSPIILPNLVNQGSDIFIQLPLASIDTPVNISLVNVVGQRVMDTSNLIAASDGTIQLPTSLLARGIYFAEIRIAGSVTRKQVLVR